MILPIDIANQLLSNLLAQLAELDLFPVIGAEIEFYINPIHANLQGQFKNLDISLEKGPNQFEVRIAHSKDVLKVIRQIESTKKLLKSKIQADFSAKPFDEHPGNSLHIHLHLENSAGENLFIKQETEETMLMLYAIGGLCETMLENMLLFAPYEQAYKRYKSGSLESPCKVCWGGNNRSAAIRIPLDQKHNRRLEHRVSCAEARAIEVMIGILSGIVKGVQDKIMPPEKLYGNAFLEQYEFPLLTQCYEKAKKDFMERI